MRFIEGIIVGLLVLGSSEFVFATEELQFFESRIRPVLIEHCYECHSSGASEAKGGLLLDFRDGLLRGGDSGPAIVPGKPSESRILDALRYESYEMPPWASCLIMSSPISRAGSNMER